MFPASCVPVRVGRAPCWIAASSYLGGASAGSIVEAGVLFESDMPNSNQLLKYVPYACVFEMSRLRLYKVESNVQG